MRKCKCGNDVADNAKACPKCGHRFTSGPVKFLAWVLGIFFGLGVLGSMMHSGSGSSSGGEVAAVDPKNIVKRDVKLKFQWHKEGFDNIMMADFTLTNPTTYRFKDVEIKCTHFAPSGTEIDSNTRTVYEVVEPKSTKRFKEVNMGFIHSQAKKSGCEIADLVVVP